jgi:hypothetical protein
MGEAVVTLEIVRSKDVKRVVGVRWRVRWPPFT